MRRLVASTALLAACLAAGLTAGVAAAGAHKTGKPAALEAFENVFGWGWPDVVVDPGSNAARRPGPGRAAVRAKAPNGPRRVSAHETSSRRTAKITGRRVSMLPPTSAGQRGTEVEPDSLSRGSTIVTAFQAGRYVDGGAAAIRWATSRDGGRSWRSGALPGLSSASGRRFSDPVVAYDAAHRRWLVDSIRTVGEERSRIVVSRSQRGLTWSAPISVVGGPKDDLDKEWIACDNGRASPFRGRCYVSYLNGATGAIETRRSADGGRKWSAPAQAPDDAPRAPGAVANGAQPLVRPDGSLVVVYVSYNWPEQDAVVAIRSTDGGATFGDPVEVAPLTSADVWGMRAEPLPSADVDAGGRLYVAWHGCPVRAECAGNHIMLATSADGIRWGTPSVVPTRSADAFIPGLAVAPGTRGGRARVAVTYHLLPECGPVALCPGIDIAIVESRDGGRSWRAPRRLNARPMQLFWIAETGFGRMTGDYISTSWAGGRPVGVYSLASKPAGGRFRQSIFAARVPVSAG